MRTSPTSPRTFTVHQRPKKFRNAALATATTSGATMMNISLYNFTTIPDRDVEVVCRAINHQIVADFAPYWDCEARMRLERTSSDRSHPRFGLGGGAVLYLLDRVADLTHALTYHDQFHRGLSFGFVLSEISARLDEPWSVSLSQEALGMVGDADVKRLTVGPHPEIPSRTVYHWHELCDAVQAETYVLEGVEVSNFVLPSYFAVDELETRTDFLSHDELRPFGVKPGGYCGFYDPQTQRHEIQMARGDEVAAARLEIKAHAFHQPVSRHRRAKLCRTPPRRVS